MAHYDLRSRATVRLFSPIQPCTSLHTCTRKTVQEYDRAYPAHPLKKIVNTPMFYIQTYIGLFAIDSRFVCIPRASLESLFLRFGATGRQ